MPDTLPRVMHLRSSCGLYGAEGVIQSLVHAYAGASVAVCFADTRGPHVELCEALSAAGLASDELPSRGTVDPLVPVRLRRLIRRHRPDVVHAHDLKSAVAASLAARRLGLVFTVHGDLRDTVGSPVLMRLGCRALRRFHVVAAVSEGTAADARSFGVPSSRISLVWNGVDTERFAPAEDRAAARRALGIPEDGCLVGAVGRLSEEKGHSVLLDAFSRVLKEQPGTRLALVGDGPLRDSLGRQARMRGVADRVSFLGRRNDAPEVYRALDAVALPSHREGLPLTVAEAGASALPVAATNVGDVARVVLDGRTGLIVPPNNPEALAGALVRLVADGDLRQRMGRAARCHVEQHFGVRAMAEAYTGLYRSAREAGR